MCPHSSHPQQIIFTLCRKKCPEHAKMWQRLGCNQLHMIFTFQRKKQQVDFCTLCPDARHILAAFLSPCQKSFSTSNVLPAKLEKLLNLKEKSGEISWHQNQRGGNEMWMRSSVIQCPHCDRYTTNLADERCIWAALRDGPCLGRMSAYSLGRTDGFFLGGSEKTRWADGLATWSHTKMQRTIKSMYGFYVCFIFTRTHRRAHTNRDR